MHNMQKSISGYKIRGHKKMFNSVSSEVDLLCKQMTIPCRHRRKTAVSLFEKDRRSMKEKVLKFRDPPITCLSDAVSDCFDLRTNLYTDSIWKVSPQYAFCNVLSDGTPDSKSWDTRSRWNFYFTSNLQRFSCPIWQNTGRKHIFTKLIHN